mgnify:CR=1 FL=1
MTSSSRPCEPLDLERDLPTTPEDVAALRRVQPQARWCESIDLEALRVPDWLVVAPRRSVFPDAPPFEL